MYFLNLITSLIFSYFTAGVILVVVFGVAMFLGDWAVNIAAWAVVLVFLGTIAYVIIGTISAPFIEERQRKERDRKAEEDWRRRFG